MVHNCLRARHIACFTIVHLICAKVQIVDNLSRISIFENDSHIHEMSSFKWYFYSKINVHDFYNVFYICVHIFRESISTTWML